MKCKGGRQIMSGKTWRAVKRNKSLYFMLIPGILFYVIFKYGPMVGLIAAFKEYQPFLGFFGSPWVGFKHFQRLFGSGSFLRIMKNTLVISGLNLFFYFPVPVIIALLLNEVRVNWFKRLVQTVIYIPHFLSWVVVVGICYSLFTTDGGIINNFIMNVFRRDAVDFMGAEAWLRPMVVFQNIWKESGWGTIIFLAALAGVDIEMYEAAKLDGASRFQQIWYITLPAIKATVITMLIIRMGSIMEAGFDQMFLMQNATNRQVSQIIDTYVYQMGMKNGQLSFATAVGLFKSAIGLVLVLVSDRFAKKIGEEGIL
ncbi:MAG: sugar ABC transporter permease [Hungatella sp.]|nr:sugar ABC transporter permease [Hungatella sp.]